MHLALAVLLAGAATPVFCSGDSLATKTGVVPPSASPFRRIATIPLPGARGRIDHMAADTKGLRLFVAELATNAVDVIDLKKGIRSRTLTSGLNEPQGVVYEPRSNRLFVANGGDGTVRVFDGSSFEPVGSLEYSGDADNLRYDSSTQTVFVGYGNGAIGAFSASGLKKLREVSIPGHPESCEVEQAGKRIFVNVPSARTIAVIDREKGKVVSQWELSAARNFPLALDEANHRLFVGFRSPSRMVVYDTDSGTQVASLDIANDVDDIFYDAGARRIFLSCGEGYLEIVSQTDADNYRSLSRVPTEPGARTSLFTPALGRLYLAVPRHQGQDAEIRVYATSR